MTKTLVFALTVVFLAMGAFASGTAEAQTTVVTIRSMSYQCSITDARRQYRLVKKDLEHAAADTDFYGERIARNAFEEADEILRTPVTATCEARAGRYRDATRVLQYALRKLEARKPKVELQAFRLRLVTLAYVR